MRCYLLLGVGLAGLLLGAWDAHGREECVVETTQQMINDGAFVRSIPVTRTVCRQVPDDPPPRAAGEWSQVDPQAATNGLAKACDVLRATQPPGEGDRLCNVLLNEAIAGLQRKMQELQK